VKDIDAAKAWYRDVLGLPLLIEAEGMAFFDKLLGVLCVVVFTLALTVLAVLTAYVWTFIPLKA